MSKFQVGIGKLDITPEMGLFMSGGLYPREYDKIKDPLYAKSIVIATEDTKIAIVTLDLLYLLNEHVNKARKAISEETGIPYENIVISTSHTHSGPYTLFHQMEPYIKESYDEILARHEKYLDRVLEAVKQSVLQANQDLEPCRLGTAKGKVEGILHNRRALKDDNDCWNTWLLPKEERDKWPAAGPVDTDLLILAAATEDNKVKAVVYNYALHANSNRIPKSISADYPAYAAKEVQSSLGSHVETFFLPGACGNINVNTSSEVIGEKIGKEIVEKLKTIDYNLEPVICTKNIVIDIPFREFTHFQEEEISRKWPSGLEYYRNEYQRLKDEKKRSVKCSLTGIRIDDSALIFNPAEFFVEFGLEIKNNSPFKHSLVVELANGYIGYVPTKISFEQGGYETFNASQSKLIPEAGEIIVKESLNILHDLKAQC
ncbi:MAG: neutral/alkaline non-lysosomal ceramidase N-terminal domain-containing protein [Caldicoprobacterales bacterium]|nr:hypothetical protein [Clostridiales bacterium]